MDNEHLFLAQQTDYHRKPNLLIPTLHSQQCAVIDLSFLKVKNLQLTARQCSQRYSIPDRPANRPAEYPNKFLQVFPLPFTNNTKGCLCHFDIIICCITHCTRDSLVATGWDTPGILGEVGDWAGLKAVVCCLCEVVGGALGDSGSGAWALKAAPWLDGSGVLFRLGAGTGLGLHSIQKKGSM